MHSVQAQDLPRRVYLGIRMENLAEDVKKVMGIQQVNGVLISEVLKGSTAEKAGFKKGDILTRINGKELSRTQDVLSVLSVNKAGDAFSFNLLRNKRAVSGKSTFYAFPKESYGDIQVSYLQCKTEIGLQRIIVQKPAGKRKKPLIVFLGGIGCYSLDSPLDTGRAELQLLNKLVRTGFISARIEKPGIGDNAGFCKPCNEVSFIEELNGYIAAIKTLKTDPDIDSNRIFIFGHSMGGIFAPLVARELSIKGIVAYGTIGSSFIEYLAKTRRTIAEAYQMTPIETDQLIRDFCVCGHFYFEENMTTAQAALKKPVCAEYLQLFDLRSREYNKELYALNIPELWSTYTGNVLLLWGSSDYIASHDDHEIIFNTLQFYKKSNAELSVVEKMDHGMLHAESYQASSSNPGKYNPVIGSVVENWLSTTMNK
ncbi:MAG: PDZ domain-containing protein [Bacteroidia bacterium]